jgi:hypothetical protein
MPFIIDVRKKFIFSLQNYCNYLKFNIKAMTECYFALPEDIEGRKKLKDVQFSDVFPQQNPYSAEQDKYFPQHVTKYVHQLRSQQHLRNMAQLMNEHLESMSLNNKPMTDDQRRVQKIKERMLKKKMMKK